MLEANTLIHARYTIIRLIGQGGMGAVYEAYDQRLNIRVALKQAPTSQLELAKAFMNEAHLLASLRHAGLPRVIDYFSDGQGQFLVMEYIPGDDLAGLLQKRQSAFPLDQVAAWAEQLCAILEYLHQQQPPIIHRDIKPQNIKPNQQGELVLLDFGLAKGSAAFNFQTTQKAASVFGYTPQYAPLEQVRGTGTDARADIYSLGATIYHLLTNQAPADVLSRASALISGEPDPLAPASQIAPSIPRTLDAVLQQALAIRPEERFASIAAFRQAFHSALQQPQAHFTPSSNPSKEPEREQGYQPTKLKQLILPIGIVFGLLLLIIVGGIVTSLNLASSFTSSIPSDKPLQFIPPPVELLVDDPIQFKGELTQKVDRIHHRFELQAKEQIFIWPMQYTEKMEYNRIQILDESQTLLFDECFACIPPGVASLPQAGTYTIVVLQQGDAALGPYELRVSLVPPEEVFDLGELGDVRTSDIADAGHIRGSGAKQIYSFELEANQVIFVSALSHDPGMQQISLSLRDAQDNEIARSCLGCGVGAIGRQLLRTGGSYRLIVGNERDPAQGEYSLRLNRVPAPDEFELSLPFERSPDLLPNAGMIKVPGAQQLYRFSASQGQAISVEPFGADAGLSQIDVRLFDADNTLVEVSCLGCGALDPYTIPKDGSYTILVGDDSDPASGSYALRVTSPNLQ
jgi:serine/threonine protein kinase